MKIESMSGSKPTHKRRGEYGLERCLITEEGEREAKGGVDDVLETRTQPDCGDNRRTPGEYGCFGSVAQKEADRAFGVIASIRMA